MKGQNVFMYLMVALAISFSACQNNQQNEEKITPDAVNNDATASGQVDEENAPKIAFKEERYDFGKIVEGERVQHIFKFTNTGKSNLIIRDAKATCGCTVPSWPQEPIAPGEQGEIEVIFDSSGKKGKQHKKITVVANTVPNKSVVAIAGEVVPAVEE